MKEIYEASSGMGEVRESALKTYGKDKKTNNNLFISISKAVGLFFASQMFSMILITVYLVHTNFTKKETAEGVGYNFSLGMSEILSTNSILILLLSEIFMIAIFVLYARFKENLSLQSLGFVWKNMPMSYLAGGAGAALSMLVLALICNATGAMVFTHDAANVPLLILFAVGFVIQGLAEEVMCRGYLIAHITRRYSVKTAVIASSILFALLHAFNPSGISFVALINLFLFGVFASLMFLYSENIWLCAGFHTIWNFVQGNVIGVPVSGIPIPSIFKMNANENMSIINGGVFGLEGGIPVTVILVTGCVILYFLIKRKEKRTLRNRSVKGSLQTQ
jgi:membrane protease YdiL (CAAX protease family)